jgi:hypothetical protein
MIDRKGELTNLVGIMPTHISNQHDAASYSLFPHHLASPERRLGHRERFPRH